jgi:DNA-binding MarR family transcriptional regulator
MTLGALATTMGVSRQTARKVITSLVERGYATVDISDTDARRRMVSLTGVGRTYTTTIIDEMTKLNEELSEKCDPADLVAAMSVLTFVKDNLGQ